MPSCAAPIYYIHILLGKNNRPQKSTRARNNSVAGKTHQADRLYRAVMLPCYHGKVNAHVNIHATCECCHVTVVKCKARQNARCARQTGKAYGKSPVNGYRRPYKRTQGARRINTRAKEKARSGHSTGFIWHFNTLPASARPLRRSTE